MKAGIILLFLTFVATFGDGDCERDEYCIIEKAENGNEYFKIVGTALVNCIDEPPYNPSPREFINKWLPEYVGRPIEIYYDGVDYSAKNLEPAVERALKLSYKRKIIIIR